MSQRFFVSSPVDTSSATLTDSEAHHLIHVMRAKSGDAVTLFDGSGAEYDACVTRIGRSEVELHIEQRRVVDREMSARVHLGIALPKGDRQRWFVEKACELGAARCTPLTTRRGVAQPEAGTLDKLRRAAIEAAKQCGRNRLPDVTEPMDWRGFLELPTTDAAKWFAHPPNRDTSAATHGDHRTDAFVSSVRASQPHNAVWLAVGPEGGFSDDEVRAALELGWRPIGLGPRILRVETAALALLAAVSSLVEWSE